jgi:RHS repeat-associated protein
MKKLLHGMRGLDMRIRTYTRIVLLLSLLLAGSRSIAQAQGPDTASKPDRGASSAGSYMVSDIESVNLTNGNVNLSIPLASLPPIAGGRLSWSIRAIYNSKHWNMKSYEEQPDAHHSQTWTHQQLELSENARWMISGTYELNTILAGTEVEVDCGTDQICQAAAAYRYKVVLKSPDGAEHELRPLGATPYTGNQAWRTGFYNLDPATLGSATAYYSYDGSYLWAIIYPPNGQVKWRVYMPDGTVLTQRQNVQRLSDTSGNVIEISKTTVGTIVTTKFTETRTGREIRYVYNPAGSGTGQVQYQKPLGEWVNIDISFTQKTLQNIVVNAGDRFCLDWSNLLTTGFQVISSISLPTTEPGIPRQFSFEYNSDLIDTLASPIVYKESCGGTNQQVTTASHGLGELSKMTLPTGAIIEYDYVQDGQQSLLDFSFGARQVPKNRIKQKRLKHSTITDTWDYSINNIMGQVTGPDGSVTKQEFYEHDPGRGVQAGGSTPLAGLVYRTTRLDSSNNRKITIEEQQWEFKKFTGAADVSPEGTVAFNPVVKATYTTVCDSLGNLSQMSAMKYVYDFNGNVTSVSEYDFFSPNVPRDSLTDVPLDVPASILPKRITTTNFNNSADADASPNVYAKRNTGTAMPLILNAPWQRVMGETTATPLSKMQYAYDGLNIGDAPTMGNVTQESTWLKYGAGSSWIDVYHTYDPIYGTLLTTDAPSGNSNGRTVTQYTYGDSTHALPTKIEICLNVSCSEKQTTLKSYDFSTGLPSSVTNVNNQVTTYSYQNLLLSTTQQSIQDPFGRVGIVTSPSVATFDPVTGVSGSGQQTVQTRYFDSPLAGKSRIDVWTDLKSTGDAKLRSRTSYDEIGRVVLNEMSEDGGTSYGISSETVYKYKPGGQNGFVTFTRNAHRNSADPQTDGWTRVKQDVAGRTVETATFNGASIPDDINYTNSTGKITTTFDANKMVVIDQAGRQQRTVVDGLGRLIRVDEPNAVTGILDSGNPLVPVQPTHYTYDALGNLLTISQPLAAGGQTRTFEYDSMSRLRKSFNPEQVNSSQVQVATTYNYDSASNLINRTIPNTPTAKMVNYTYDSLNRLKTKQLSTGEQYTYTYDTSTNGVGRLASVTRDGTGDGTYYSSYDMLGRVTVSQQKTTASGTQYSYTFSYGYNLAGNKTKEVYPSGKEYRTIYDDAGRINQVSRYNSNNTLDKTYASGILYTAQGAMTQMNLGNGTREMKEYNSRLQPTKIELRKVSNNDLILGLDYGYGVTGQNNGNISQQVIRLGHQGSISTLVQAYDYDFLNRLKSANENSSASWSQTYGYDRYGNRWVSASTGHNVNLDLTPTQQSQISATTNRLLLSGFSYDDSGNQKSQTRLGVSEIMNYDAENLMWQFQSGSNTSTYTYDGEGRRVKRESAGSTSIYVYNIIGQMIAEYTTPDPAPPVGGGTSYITNDHLGSPRVVTNANGGVKARHDYLPFGEELGLLGGRTLVMGYSQNDGLRQQFAGKEKDMESGLHYFQARYFSSAQGRFASVDPISIKIDRILDPQQINLYHYARNNPLRWIDPTGEDIVENIDPKYREDYEKWKKAFLATKSGRAQWEKYANDKNFTLTITFGSNAGGDQGAQTTNYVYDSNGSLTGATIILGPDLAKNQPQDPYDYPVTSTLSPDAAYSNYKISRTTRAIAILAHEIGHVDYGRTLGPLYRQQNELLELYDQRYKQVGPSGLNTDTQLLQIKKQLGDDPVNISHRRELEGERRVIPVLEEHFGKDMPSRVKKGIQEYKKANP